MKVIGNCLVHVDAEKGGHLAVLFAGALGAAQRRLVHEVPEGRKQHDGDDDDQHLLPRHGAHFQ